MQVYYKAGYSADKIKFDNENYWLEIGDLLSYEWDYTTFNKKISQFSKSITKRKFSVTVTGSCNMSWAKACDRLISIFDTDVRMKHPGRIYIDDWYIEGYVIKSDKELSEPNAFNTYTDGISENSFTFVSEQEFWRKETTYTYGRDAVIEGLTYPKSYPYGYVNSNKKINNKEYVPCDFIMKIYGACINPAVSIGTQTYELKNFILNTGEYLVINSLEKTVNKIKIGGSKESAFSYRNRNFDIFAKIPAGSSLLGWQEGLVFDITLITERGEPEWKKT